MFLFSGKAAAVWRLRGRRDDFSRPPPVWFLFLFKVEFWNVCFCAWRNAFGSWANPRSLHPARCGGRLLLGRVRGIRFLFLTLGFPAEGFVFASAAVDERERPAAPLFLFLLVWIFSLIFGVFLWFPVVSLKLGARSSVRRFRLDVTNDGFANDVFDSWWGSGGREEGRTTF